MSLRAVVIAMVLVVGIVAAITWKQQVVPVPSAGAPNAAPSGELPPATAPALEAANDPGMTWSTPERWSELPARSMRFATYAVPAAGGDAEAGECAVFHFGIGQGGGVDANLDRWVAQFEHARDVSRSRTEQNGLTISRVKVAGDYLAPSGPMMESSSKKAKFMLLGAIVEGPNGSVFFKFTGYQKTVQAAESEFQAMLQSLK
ncbi:MAG: hypothetical protein ABIU54_07160 [Candidatus Eisenbacteria bacterium]